MVDWHGPAIERQRDAATPASCPFCGAEPFVSAFSRLPAANRSAAPATLKYMCASCSKDIRDAADEESGLSREDVTERGSDPTHPTGPASEASIWDPVKTFQANHVASSRSWRFLHVFSWICFLLGIFFVFFFTIIGGIIVMFLGVFGIAAAHHYRAGIATAQMMGRLVEITEEQNRLIKQNRE